MTTWAVIAATALIVRAAYVLIAHAAGGVDAFLVEDSIQYLRQGAAAIENEAPFGFAADGTAIYEPQILPLIPFLFYVLGVAGEAEIWRFIALQVALDTGTCVIIALTALSLPGANAKLAGFVAALNPTQIVMVSLALTDTVTLFFLALALLGVTRLIGERAPHLVWSCAAIVVGIVVASYARYATIPMGLALGGVAVALLLSFGRVGVRRVAALGLVAIVSWAAVQPIPLRNEATFGHREFSDQYGVHMLFWVVPYARDLGAGVPHDVTLAEAEGRYDAAVAEHGEPQNSFEKTTLMNEVGMAMLWETGFGTLSASWIVGSALNMLTPAAAAAPWARTLKTGSFTETPGENGFDKAMNFLSDPGNSTYAAVMGFGVLGVLLWVVLGLTGAGRLLIVEPRVALFLLAWVAVVLAITGPIVSPKYRLPLEPVWCLFVATALPWIWIRLKGMRNAVR